MSLEIPQRPYFRIGQVAKLLDLPTHVLRYWEKEFPGLGPTRAPSGHRIYHRKDVEALAVVKRLLHQEGYTIAGARKRLQEMSGEAPPPQPQPPPQPPQPEPKPEKVLGELKDILKILD